MRRPRTVPGTVSLWLLVYENDPTATCYVEAGSAAAARRLAVRDGRPEPDRVTHAGAVGLKPKAPPRRGPKRSRDAVPKRARLALRLWASLRADWPVPSILAERRHRDAVLLAFVADFGTALEQLPPSQRREVLALLEAEQRAITERARELRADRAGDRSAAALHRRRWELHRSRAARLGKRQTVRRGLRALDRQLAGAADRQLAAAERFAAWLCSVGYTDDEAARFTAAWSRVLIPRL